MEINDRVIFDFETLGTEPDCILLSLGIIAFDGRRDYKYDEMVKRGKQYKFDVASQKKAGRTYTTHTLDWWKMQSDEARTILRPDPNVDIPYDSILDCFDSYFEDMNVDSRNSFFYCRGKDFDYGIVKNLAFNQKRENPMPYHRVHCIRTVIHTLAEKGEPLINKMEPPSGFVVHNAVHDCAFDYIRIKTAENLTLPPEVPKGK